MILCYHGVSFEDEHEWDAAYYVPAQLLEARLRFLRDRGYCVLPLGEALQRLYAGELPAKSVAITFDDGTSDFYLKAWPLLKRYEMPATVYLTTYYCGRQAPVFGMFCHYLMYKGRTSYRGGPLPLLKDRPDLTSPTGRKRAADTVVDSAERMGLPQKEKDALVRELAVALGVDYEALLARRILQLMNPSEVAQLAREGADIGLHTHRHRLPKDPGLLAKEIEDNRRAIREMIGDRPLVHFCYPNGEYDLAMLPWLERQGIESATTCDSGLASMQTNRLLLPRIVDHSGLSGAEFEGWLSGLSEAPRILPWI